MPLPLSSTTEYQREKCRQREHGHLLYRQLRQTGWPSGFQVLCLNCNWKKHILHNTVELVEE